MEKIIVQNNEKGVRLDSYITKKLNDLSRANIQRLIEDGNILVNSAKQKISYKVNSGDKI